MTAKRRRAVANRRLLGEQVRERSRGVCEFPECFNNGMVIAHLLTRGMGGVPSRDELGNLAHLCHFHDWVIEPQNPKRGNWRSLERYDALRMLVTPGVEYQQLAEYRFERAGALRAFIEGDGNKEKLTMIASIGG